ncbi:MAG: hypothetical protein E3J72_05550 [Planctomycetota bacterium]|nr:MAG: hypothetical protein E3J72_05550 [Planctomycetota bacterium]
MSRARILFLGAILAVLSFIILNAPAGAEDEQAGEAVKMYFAAKDDDQRAYILKVIKKSGASLDDLAAALPGRREFEKPETENNVCSHKFENNDEAVFYVPDTYDGKKPFGLIIHLFGAGGNGDVGAYRWAKTAGQEDYIILTPYRPAGNMRGREIGESRWWQDDVAKFVKEKPRLRAGSLQHRPRPRLRFRFFQRRARRLEHRRILARPDHGRHGPVRHPRDPL